MPVENQQEKVSEEDFFAAFGVETPNTEGETNDNDAEETEGSEEQDTNVDEGHSEDASDDGAEGDAESGESSEQQDTKAADAEAKRAAAFAQLRTDNKKSATLLKSVADLLGIDGALTSEAMEQALQAKVLAAQSKKQGVPPELLKEVKDLRADQEFAKQEALKRTTLLGFQKVKDTFGLDNNAVQQFAAELENSGINPFETPTNLINEYKVRHYEDLIAAAEERGAQKEAERSNKANNHGSNPGNKTGKSNVGAEKVNTQKELEALLSGK